MLVNQGARTSLWSRGGPLLAVIGVHALALYAITVSMGIVKIPLMQKPIEAVFIPEETEVQPEPEIPVVKPEIADVVQPVDEPAPQIEVEEVVAPPSDIPMEASPNAIAAAPAAAAPKELKTSSRVEPLYPPTSRRMSEEGTVQVRVLVDERGRPKEVNVGKSSGFPRLDEAAVEAVRKWRFVAATNGAGPISSWTQVAVTFRLTNA
jgi:periplasmic protein TonB